jgi:hypothetical protein
MYASHGVDLCTMYDSHGVYLCILLTICMYKFSRCHAIVFHGFSIPMPDFLDNSAGLTLFARKSPGRFSVKVSKLLVNAADNSVNSTEFRFLRVFLFLLYVNCVSAEFS